ncbi:MAG: Ig-like domain-containing protein, partial [Lachnospiraceae bacterium]|nr:Ig-like domain-containing protein [Lachnospiraceae bacterium]
MKNRLSVKCISVMLCSVLLLGMAFQTIPAEELSQQGNEEDGGILVDKEPVDEDPVEESADENPVEELIDEEPVEVFVDHEPIEGMVDEEPAIFTYDPENEGTGEFSDLTKRSGDIDADITGTYYTLSAETILNKLNAIRKEAYQEGLTSKYVPLKWSAVIESAARKRAMEAGITMNHRDLNDGSISQYMGYKTSFYGWAENLAWNNTHNADGILVGIDQFYEEKEEYLKERAGKEHGVTGHYTSIINPDFQYVGVSGCQMNGTPNNWFTVAMQLGSSPQGTISQTKDPSNGVITNTLKVGAKYVSSFSVSGPAQMSEEETQGYDITGKIAYPTKGTYGTVTEDFSITYGQERGVTWTSSQPSVASVSNGVVTAHQAGNATITAKIGTKTVTKEITVNAGVPTVQAVNLDKNSYRLFTTQSSIQVTATIDPVNVEQKTVFFRSSDPDVFTVSKGDGAGSAEVSVDAVDGIALIKLNRVASANKNAKLTVMVDGTSVRKEANVAIIVPTSDFSIIQDGTDASFAGKTWEASIGESTVFTCKVVPENAYDKKITWKSSNEGIAKISSKGDSGAVVTCMGTGQATITCTSENAPEKIIRTFTVKGGIKATSVSLNRKSLTLYKGQTYQLSAMVLPEGLEAVITYKSDKESVAKVSANGLVTAVGEGVAKITASSLSGDGAFFLRCRPIGGWNMKLYNTMSHRKEEFVPTEPGKVKM